MYKYILLLFFSIFSIAQRATTSWNLQQTLNYALETHPRIKQSLLEVTIKKQQENSAKGMFLPSVSAGVNQSFSFGSTINPGTNQREALNVGNSEFLARTSWELFNWQNFMKLSLSKMNKQSAAYRLKDTENEMALKVIELFYDYQNSRAWLSVLQNQLEGIEEQIKRIKKEVEIGNRALSDVYDIKANLGTLQEQWISAKNQKELAKINLLHALAIREDTLEFHQPEHESPSNLIIHHPDFVQQMLEKNPAYLAVLKQYEAAKQNIKVEKSVFLPSISGHYSWSSFYSRTLQSKGSVTTFNDQFQQNKNQQITLSLAVPIFNRLQTKSKVRIAEIEKHRAEFSKDLAVNDLVRALKSIQIQYQNSQQKYLVLEQNFENQKLSFEKSEEKYKEGLMDAYTFFVVRNNWLQANYNLIKSKYDVLLQEEILKIFNNQ